MNQSSCEGLLFMTISKKHSGENIVCGQSLLGFVSAGTWESYCKLPLSTVVGHAGCRFSVDIRRLRGLPLDHRRLGIINCTGRQVSARSRRVHQYTLEESQEQQNMLVNFMYSFFSNPMGSSAANPP